MMGRWGRGSHLHDFHFASLFCSYDIIIPAVSCVCPMVVITTVTRMLAPSELIQFWFFLLQHHLFSLLLSSSMLDNPFSVSVSLLFFIYIPSSLSMKCIPSVHTFHLFFFRLLCLHYHSYIFTYICILIVSSDYFDIFSAFNQML